jgi:hypothetical protein
MEAAMMFTYFLVILAGLVAMLGAICLVLERIDKRLGQVIRALANVTAAVDHVATSVAGLRREQ